MTMTESRPRAGSEVEPGAAAPAAAGPPADRRHGASLAAIVRRLPFWARVALPVGVIAALTFAGAALGRTSTGARSVRAAAAGPLSGISTSPQTAERSGGGPGLVRSILEASEASRPRADAPLPTPDDPSASAAPTAPAPVDAAPESGPEVVPTEQGPAPQENEAASVGAPAPSAPADPDSVAPADGPEVVDRPAQPSGAESLQPPEEEEAIAIVAEAAASSTGASLDAPPAQDGSPVGAGT